MTASYLKKCANNKESYLEVRLRLGAERTAWRGQLPDGSLKISLAAQAERGEANRALRRFLAAEAGVPADQVEIVRGGTIRRKLVRITY